jgi:hypothetical protein
MMTFFPSRNINSGSVVLRITTRRPHAKGYMFSNTYTGNQDDSKAAAAAASIACSTHHQDDIFPGKHLLTNPPECSAYHFFIFQFFSFVIPKIEISEVRCGR